MKEILDTFDVESFERNNSEMLLDESISKALELTKAAKGKLNPSPNEVAACSMLVEREKKKLRLASRAAWIAEHPEEHEADLQRRKEVAEQAKAVATGNQD